MVEVERIVWYTNNRGNTERAVVVAGVAASSEHLEQERERTTIVAKKSLKMYKLTSARHAQ